ncbi:sugar phosphate nucleotidyltransferase [Butyrivibrio proteoclasticus]|nr:sugar phosphate nucleotidyltransferase [Butyrivibrio proteoclasticus]
MKKNIANCLSTENITVVDAMKKIQDNARGVLYIVDENGKFLGSVTDGDIRRWVIQTGNITGTVSMFLNRNAKCIMESQRDIADNVLNTLGVRSLPIIDDNGFIKDIVFDEFYSSAGLNDCLKDVPIIIMAGGKGTRLYPYTKILPKPLIPIGEVPIIERIMNQFHKYGACDFYLVLNYKREMIKSYFMDQKLPYQVEFVNEEEPLGTAGGIRLIDRVFTSPVIVTNCDILIEADYEDIISCHKQLNNDMTIVSSLKNISIPYGVLETGENGKVLSMREKPSIPTMVNTGMYIINPKFIDWIPEKEVFHMTQLAQKLIDSQKKVGMYPIDDNSFLDMGEFEEMKRMEKRLSDSR